MVFGKLPIAMASGAGAEMNNSLAIVIIGGLLFSLFPTLVIVPVVYLIVVGLEERFSTNKDAKYEYLVVAEHFLVYPMSAILKEAESKDFTGNILMPNFTQKYFFSFLRHTIALILAPAILQV